MFAQVAREMEGLGKADGQPVLRAAGITRRFGTLEANRDVNVALFPGEIHVLLGQNGAGKSTLIKVFTGRLAQDDGSVWMRDVELPRGEPLAALGAGIGAVFQDLQLIPTMTGLENLVLALRSESFAKRVEDLIHHVSLILRRFGVDVALDVPVKEMSMPDRQRLAVLRALCGNPRVLILDEPTDLLPPIAVSAFLENLRALADEGIAVLFVTHRLPEMRAVADRLTVMRDGNVVGSFRRNELPHDRDLAVLMVGATLENMPDVHAPGHSPVISARDLFCPAEIASSAISGVSLEVLEGEIVGLAGIDGNGQQELLEAIAGLRDPSSGSVYLRESCIDGESYRSRRRLGLFYVSGDRDTHGVVPGLTVEENLVLRQGSGGSIEPRETIDKVGLLPRKLRFPAENLSGGNQQKLLLGGVLQDRPAALVLSYPLRGLDIQATRAISTLLIEQASMGVAILIAGSDLEGLLAICHRLVVMDRGEIVGEQRRDAFDASEVAVWLARSSDAGSSVSVRDESA